MELLQDALTKQGLDLSCVRYNPVIYYTYQRSPSNAEAVARRLAEIRYLHEYTCYSELICRSHARGCEQLRIENIILSSIGGWPRTWPWKNV